MADIVVCTCADSTSDLAAAPTFSFICDYCQLHIQSVMVGLLCKTKGEAESSRISSLGMWIVDDQKGGATTCTGISALRCNFRPSVRCAGSV